MQFMANATLLYKEKAMLGQEFPSARVTLGPCSSKMGTGVVECWRDKKADAVLADLSLSICLDLCKLVFVNITGICFPPTEKQSCCLNSDSGHVPSYSAQCNLGSLLVNIFCQQPARKHKISADKICRCCRVQGVVNNDQNRTLIWVFS